MLFWIELFVEFEKIFKLNHKINLCFFNGANVHERIAKTAYWW